MLCLKSFNLISLLKILYFHTFFNPIGYFYKGYIFNHNKLTGLPEDRAKSILQGSQSLEILIDDGKVSLTRGDGRTQVLTLNQAVEETGPGGSFKVCTVYAIIKLILGIHN